MPPNLKYQVVIPETYTVTSFGKGDFAQEIKGLEMGRILWIS